MPCRSVTGRSVKRAERVAPDAERRRPPPGRRGVGDDRARPQLEREELEMAERRVQRTPAARSWSSPPERARSAWCAGASKKTAGWRACRRASAVAAAARRARVAERWPEGAASAGRSRAGQAMGPPGGAGAGAGVGGAQRVDGRRAERVHAALGYALGQQVGGGVAAVGQQRVGQAVDDDAVDLLRCRPVQRAQAATRGGRRPRRASRSPARRPASGSVAREQDEVGAHPAQDVVEAVSVVAVSSAADPEAARTTWAAAGAPGRPRRSRRARGPRGRRRARRPGGRPAGREGGDDGAEAHASARPLEDVDDDRRRCSSSGIGGAGTTRRSRGADERGAADGYSAEPRCGR